LSQRVSRPPGRFADLGVPLDHIDNPSSQKLAIWTSKDGDVGELGCSDLQGCVIEYERMHLDIVVLRATAKLSQYRTTKNTSAG